MQSSSSPLGWKEDEEIPQIRKHFVLLYPRPPPSLNSTSPFSSLASISLPNLTSHNDPTFPLHHRPYPPEGHLPSTTRNEIRKQTNGADFRTDSTRRRRLAPDSSWRPMAWLVLAGILVVMTPVETLEARETPRGGETSFSGVDEGPIERSRSTRAHELQSNLAITSQRHSSHASPRQVASRHAHSRHSRSRHAKRTEILPRAKIPAPLATIAWVDNDHNDNLFRFESEPGFEPGSLHSDWLTETDRGDLGTESTNHRRRKPSPREERRTTTEKEEEDEDEETDLQAASRVRDRSVVSVIQERMDKQDEAINFLKSEILALKVNAQADHNKILHLGKEVEDGRWGVNDLKRNQNQIRLDVRTLKKVQTLQNKSIRALRNSVDSMQDHLFSLSAAVEAERRQREKMTEEQSKFSADLQTAQRSLEAFISLHIEAPSKSKKMAKRLWNDFGAILETRPMTPLAPMTPAASIKKTELEKKTDNRPNEINEGTKKTTSSSSPSSSSSSSPSDPVEGTETTTPTNDETKLKEDLKKVDQLLDLLEGVDGAVEKDVIRLGKEEKRLRINFEKIQTKYKDQDRVIGDVKATVSSMLKNFDKVKENVKNLSSKVKILSEEGKRKRDGHSGETEKKIEPQRPSREQMTSLQQFIFNFTQQLGKLEAEHKHYDLASKQANLNYKDIGRIGEMIMNNSDRLEVLDERLENSAIESAETSSWQSQLDSARQAIINVKTELDIETTSFKEHIEDTEDAMVQIELRMLRSDLKMAQLENKFLNATLRSCEKSQRDFHQDASIKDQEKKLEKLVRLHNEQSGRVSKLEARMAASTTVDDRNAMRMRILHERIDDVMQKTDMIPELEAEVRNVIGHLPEDCSDILKDGATHSGSYLIKPKHAKRSLPVFCQIQTANKRAFLVVQRRFDGRESFDRSWNEYKTGFGNVNQEFWVGNENLHLLTEQGNYSLIIEMTSKEGEVYVAVYDRFQVKSEDENYKLRISGYHGNATDAMSHHDDLPFSTFDRDNDFSTTPCAKFYSAGWWYKHCHNANLNGRFGIGVIWFNLQQNDWISLRETRMKLVRNAIYDEPRM